MKIKIAHLYYDLLNLYGEQGNIIALTDSLKRQNIETEVALLSLNDKFDLKKYDVIYMGSGSDENLIIALEDFKKHTKKFITAIKNNQYIISTGNSHELFGKFIEMNNQKYEASGIFDYYAKQNPKRIVGESHMEFKDLPPIIGFQNRTSVIQSNKNYLFSVINGHAYNYKSSYEGYNENNFFGTYLIGPLLIRNPYFTDYLIKKILKDKDLPYEEITDTYEHKAYNEYLKNFYNQ